MLRGGSRGREPVGGGEGEIEERYAGLFSLPWPPRVQDSCPKVFSLLSTLPQRLAKTVAPLGAMENKRKNRDCPEWGNRMLASDTEIGVKQRRESSNSRPSTPDSE